MGLRSAVVICVGLGLAGCQAVAVDDLPVQFPTGTQGALTTTSTPESSPTPSPAAPSFEVTATPVVGVTPTSAGSTPTERATLTQAPTAGETQAPTAGETQAPTAGETQEPTAAETDAPTAGETQAPTAAETDAPTAGETQAPTTTPTALSTEAPTEVPTAFPTAAETDAPTAAPSATPTHLPTAASTPSATATAPLDPDGDGQTVAGGDCNNDDPDIFAGAQERYSDGVDSNCNGYEDIIFTLAGGGGNGPSDDGVLAEAAALSQPNGIAVGPDGSIYFSEENANRVRVLRPDGKIYPFAGDNGAGFYGDGGPAVAAKLKKPHGLAVDGVGNVYIADRDNHVIRKVDLSGEISTVAGVGGQPGYSGDGNYATAAKLNKPTGVDVDAFGALYIADSENRRVRKVYSFGVINTVAGDGADQSDGDGLTATLASMKKPFDVKVAPEGGFYVSDHEGGRLRYVSPLAFISTAAGGGSGDADDWIAGEDAELDSPRGLAFDRWGELYITIHDDRVIYRMDGEGRVRRVAGDGSQGSAGDGEFSGDAQIDKARFVAVTADGALLIADRPNNRIRIVYW